MRYSIIEDERVEDGSIIDEEDEITEKIPIEKFCQINNAAVIFDDPVSLVRIVLLRAKSDFINYYGSGIYAVFVRTENNDAWFGSPIKNTSVGLMRWEKAKFHKVYGFSLSMTMQEDP